MMAASTVGLAFGGPGRMLFEQPKAQIPSTKSVNTPPPVIAEGRVKGWFLYDPDTEDFRQSSVDERKEEEQIAAQTLVDVCEQALDDVESATACDYEREPASGLLRTSFSFVVSKESFEPSPSASPFSGGRGKEGLIAPITIISDCYGGHSQQELGRVSSSNIDVNLESSVASASTSSSSSTIINIIEHDTPSLKVLPPLRETRLGSHRGSVMESGIVLDPRIFGGIGVVQDGRKVGVRRSEGSLRLKAAASGAK